MSGGSDARAAFVDGKLVYVPSYVKTKRTRNSTATYQRESLSANASSQLGQYPNVSTSGKLPKLLNAAKKIADEPGDIVIDLDIARPTSNCLIPGIGTLKDASELTQALGIS